MDPFWCESSNGLKKSNETPFFYVLFPDTQDFDFVLLLKSQLYIRV